jgi:hypothetical protein
MPPPFRPAAVVLTLGAPRAPLHTPAPVQDRPIASLPPRAELDSVPLTVDRGVAAGEGFPPRESKSSVAVEFACLFAHKPAWSPAGCGDPSRSGELPSFCRGVLRTHARSDALSLVPATSSAHMPTRAPGSSRTTH